VTAVVSAAPYYFSIGQSEVCDYMRELADGSVLPLFLYNIPPCVDISLAFETFEQLAGHPNICGFKDSAGDIAAFRQLLQLRSLRPDWSMLMGHESLLGESVLMGSDGGVPGGGNLFPKLFVDIFDAAEKSDRKEVDRLQAHIVRLGSLYTLLGTGAAGYLRGLKGALEVAGLCSNEVTTPFHAATESERVELAGFIASIGVQPSPSVA
jgi:4-hydroxy-tetrahydrodipicolinate synthase